MHPKNYWWLIIVLAILLVGASAYFIYRQSTKKSTSSSTPTTSSSFATEIWQPSGKTIFSDVTSTSTVKLADGTYRMYLQQKGAINYADSADATTFSTPVSTGIIEKGGTMISNPSVLKIADGNWIMIFEIAPNVPPQNVKGNGPATQRNLVLATSADGKSFQEQNVVIDSAKADNYFASVPNLVSLPNGKIRLYYVSGGNAIGSAISTDGKTWTREDGLRIDDGVDPDVLLDVCCEGRQNWVMYFATLTGANNAFYKATSSDGLTWKKGPAILRPSNEKAAIVDPDVIKIGENKYRMFYGEIADGAGQFGGSSQINLTYADFSGDIFAQ